MNTIIKPVSKRKLSTVDFIIFCAIASLLYLILNKGNGTNVEVTGAKISTDLNNLPYYALLSTLRMAAAYALSFIFTLIYGSIAAHNDKAAKVMIPLLDILQSIPVLSFLPAVVIGLISIFPNSNVGLELASIILIFTGQVWNMTFSFYYSIKGVPKDLIEAAHIFQLNKWEQFKTVELPSAAIGLVWNSMMSWAGGWFFLMACEMFTMEGKDFRLKGLGSFLQTAANEGNTKALWWGIITLVLVIVLMDRIIWRPIISWSEKFKIESTGTGEEHKSYFLMFLRRSLIIQFLEEKVIHPVIKFLGILIDKIALFFLKRSENRNKKTSKIIGVAVKTFFLIILVYYGFNALKLVLKVSNKDLKRIPLSVFYSFLRVTVAQVISLAWTLPVGVAIGMNKKTAKIFQPIIQVIASIPATALFPVILSVIIKKSGGLGFASVLLMLMGTQWYLLFNIIAGAMAIPEDLINAADILGLKGLKRWKVLILPSIFPYLLTGMITATGGCWNASIVSEYVHFSGKTVKTIGLGALISEATETGNYPLLLLSTIIMCLVVVGINNSLWKRLYRISEEKFRLDI
ncbi:MAG TPA: ABC transporter permease [Clostridiaceae bacterium]|jgi:NitT/TauT family transport system permease protein|nr:ABC transporter permease [Clostridiaceae bacterium]HBX48735.1 ABC transporter permease [Clostridiaceae bacterium]